MAFIGVRHRQDEAAIVVLMGPVLLELAERSRDVVDRGKSQDRRQRSPAADVLLRTLEQQRSEGGIHQGAALQAARSCR